jgi:pyruvate dehydrogenase E2 component (dihydrolipoamide acetyltransferase)
VARALKTHPQLNSTLEGDAIHLHEQVHIGLAVDTPAGLLVPVLREVDRKDVATIGAESRALVERARTGRLSAADLSGGTFTLTSLGAFGIDAFTPIVNPPQTAILGVGRVAQKPVERDGRVEPGATLVQSLSFDHQVVDGAPAARFLQEIARAVEAGEFA